jgi:NADPH:quinone reductase-like Zn-dependent oxidoreductase
MAGTIEEVGAGVLDFAPGDEVYGCAGAPHGLPITHQQQLNADLLAFIKS